MIEKTCENCCVCEKAGDETHDIYKCLCSDDKPCFSPKEELVRQDERENIRQQILNSNFYIEDDNGKTYEILANELKPKMIDTFEESIRQDEKNKILDLLKEDLEDYRKARKEYKDNKNISIELAGVFIYINTLINEIESEQL